MAFLLEYDGMKRRFGFLWILLILLFVGIFCYSGYRLISELHQARSEKSAFSQLASQRQQALAASAQHATMDASGMQSDSPQEPESSDPVAPEVPIEPEEPDDEPLPEYQVFYELNPDFFGWLSIEGTEFDYPVVFTPDRPEYYLRRAFDGSYSHSGVPFLDTNWNGDDAYYLIYGHNMKIGTMFGQLLPYQDAAYQKEHPIIQFDTLYEHHRYEVMAVFLSRVYYQDEEPQGEFRYYEYLELPTEEVFREFVQQVKESALYDTGVEAEYGDSILVLSTCNYHTEDGRFVLVAREKQS